MDLIIKAYQDLTIDELWEIYHIRAEVFVVEQNCVYQDIDEKDKRAYHLWFSNEDGMQAYARVFPVEGAPGEAAIGRVLSKIRRQGVATELMRAAIEAAKNQLQATRIVLSAQVYTKQLYENVGFIQISEEYLEDEIPHVKMEMLVHTT